jgi:disulfide bond formation protein DsbB
MLAIVNILNGIGGIVGQILILIFLYVLFFEKNSTAAKTISRYAVPFAFLVALGSVIMSLYYSDVIGYEPCKLCWLQRIFLYPEVILLGLAMWRKEIRLITPYALAVAVVGLPISIYHNLLQLDLVPNIACSASAVSCTKQYVYEFGYITIPLLALTGFLLIILPLIIALRTPTDESTT